MAIASCRDVAKEATACDAPQARFRPCGLPGPDDMPQSMNAPGLKNTKSRRTKMRNLRVAHIAATLYGSHQI